MKVWQVTFNVDPASGEQWREFHRTKRGAEAVMSKHDDLEEIDIPTDKSALIDWLNRECT